MLTLAALSLSITGNAVIDLIVFLVVLAILAYFLKYFLAEMGIPIPRIVLIGIGCIIAILLILWVARLASGV